VDVNCIFCFAHGDVSIGDPDRTGYAVDRRIGTTDGLGGLFGLLQGMRSPVPSFVTHTTGDLLAPLFRVLGLLPPPGTAETNTVPVPEHQLPAEELLALTKELLFAQKLGVEDPTLLDEDRFTFTGPAVGGPRSKADFLSPSKTRRVLCVGTFQFEDEAFPDLDYQYRDLCGCARTIPIVSGTRRVRGGTHTGTIQIGNTVYPPTQRTWHSPPELWFDAI